MTRIGILSPLCPDSPTPSTVSFPPTVPDRAPVRATVLPVLPQTRPHFVRHSRESRSSSAAAAHTPPLAFLRPESPAISNLAAGAFPFSLICPKASLTHLPLINLQVVKCNCSRFLAVEPGQNRNHSREAEFPIHKTSAAKSQRRKHRLDHSRIPRIGPRQSSHIIAIHPGPRAAHIFQSERKTRGCCRHGRSVRHFCAANPYLSLAHIRRGLQRPAENPASLSRIRHHSGRQPVKGRVERRGNGRAVKPEFIRIDPARLRIRQS